ncbi:MAG: helix-turn-helix domain-containing protein, partial [Acidobacteriota bacterium]
MQEEIHATAETRYLHQLHAILLVVKDWNAYEVAALFGHSPRTIESYIHAVNSQGLEGLKEQTRPGRKRRLNEQ